MESAKEKIPVQEGLFTWPSDEPRLLGAICTKCGHHVFPYQDMCPDCCDETMEQTELSNKGKLFSFTGIYAPPPDFKGNVLPYTVGILELPEGVKIIGLTTVESVSKLKVGMEMEIIVDTVYEENGVDVLSYKYRPLMD